MPWPLKVPIVQPTTRCATTWVRVFIAQHINALLREEPEQGNKNEVLFMLDEFAKMGTVPEVQKGLEIGRSYGVRFWVFL